MCFIASQGYMCCFVNNETTSSDISANDVRCLFGNVEDVYNFNRLAQLSCQHFCVNSISLIQNPAVMLTKDLTHRNKDSLTHSL